MLSMTDWAFSWPISVAGGGFCQLVFQASSGGMPFLDLGGIPSGGM